MLSENSTTARMWNAPQLPILVRQSVFEDADDTAIVSAVVDYINDLGDRGYYLPDEMPANAMRAYYTDYYLAQVSNGGHGQFMHNSRMEPLVFQDIREGLAAIGIRPYIDIFGDFEALSALDAERTAAIAAGAGFGPQEPAVAELDNRFFDQRGYETLMPANGRWLKSLPELKVVPDAEFEATVQSLFAANPHAKARKIAGERERFYNRMQDSLQVAARLLAYEAEILPVHITMGDPAAKMPDGRGAVGWGISSPQGHYTMFMLDDVVLLCEQHLPDGRKITREVFREITTGKGSVERGRKEIVRLPVAFVEEAMAAAKDGYALAAAEIACARLDDEIVEVHALAKDEDGMWGFALWAKKAQYGLFLREADVAVVRAPDAVKLLVIPLEEITRHKAASEGGPA